MATSTKKWSRRVSNEKRIRVLTAAATRVNIDNRAEVRRQRSVRQNWQLDSYIYRNSIGELRYAVNFLANCAARMRMFVAALPTGGESDMPVDITKLEGVPPAILAVCANAIVDLGNGRVAMANLMHSASTNLSLAGEMFLLGQEDPDDGKQTWSIRSISEIVVMNEELKLREGPIDSTGLLGLIDLDPALTTISRMWQPDPEWRLLADSPMKAILNECESLLILRRMIRATGRSRLAGAGLLLFPDEVSIVVNNDDDQDPESDPVMGALANAMMTPIVNEGDASAVVPIVIRGPGEHLAQIRLVELGHTFDELAGKTRDELIGVIATGLDLPKEIILGVADLNHWSAWQVDDNTFRHHVEPHVITLSDCFTSGFLRPYLESSNVPSALLEEWMPRIMFWYDPTELVTHPDRMQNANLLHAALAISDETYRDVGGFGDDDAPSSEEIEIRMIRTMRTWPANVIMALLHALDPALAVPAMTGPPALPGIKPGAAGGADVPDLAVAPVGGATPAPSTISAAPVPSPSAPPDLGPPDITASAILDELDQSEIDALVRVLHRFANTDQRALTASGAWKPPADAVRASRKLQQIDADLRTKLQVKCNDAMLRHLEQAGGKLRNKVAKNETLRTKIAMTKNEHVLMVLGREISEKAGITAAGVIASTWDQLHDQFMQWTSEAQQQAVKTAMQLAGETDQAFIDSTTHDFALSQSKGWNVLSDSMNSVAVNLAHNADPNMTIDEAIANFNPDTIVPTGAVRAALAVTGGTPEGDLGIITTKFGVEVPAIPLGYPVGGIGTGASISNLLSSSGAKTTSYEWVHGPTLRPFDPHLELDGVTFSSFTDDALANVGDFPANSYFMPGDHIGCLCDVTPLWVSAQDVQDAMTNGGVDTSTWPASAFNTPTGVVPKFSPIQQAKTPPVDELAAKFDAMHAKSDAQLAAKNDAMKNAQVTNVADLAKLDNAAKGAGYEDFADLMDTENLTAYEAKAAAGAPSLSAIESSDNPFATANMLDKQRLTDADVQSYRQIAGTQQTALSDYTGSGHTLMNQYLRFDETPYGWTEKSYVNEYVNPLKRAIASQPRTSADLIVGRIGYLPKGLKVGGEFTDKGFVSTARYGGDMSYGRGEKMIISLPKGTQLIDVNKSFESFGSRNSTAEEKEMILPPGSKFRVDAINNDGTYVLTHIPKAVRSVKK